MCPTVLHRGLKYGHFNVYFLFYALLKVTVVDSKAQNKKREKGITTKIVWSFLRRTFGQLFWGVLRLTHGLRQ